MDRLLSLGQGVKPIEHNIDVARIGAEVEDLLESAHRRPLDELVRTSALEAALDKREQEPLAEEEAVTCVEVPAHPLGPHDEPLHEPGEAVEHVVEGEECIWNHDT